MGDKSRGIYHKFNVTRTDGTSVPGGKHDSCFYFVLDLDHDPHAKAAIKAYADSCRAEYPRLAADLDVNVKQCAFGGKITPNLGAAVPVCGNCGQDGSGDCDPREIALKHRETAGKTEVQK